MIRSGLFLFVLIFIIGCIDPPQYPLEPQIEFLSQSSNTLIQGNFPTDTMTVSFTFTDGDGDLGSQDSLNIFLVDTRDDFVVNRYRIPFIPEEGTGNGIEGTIRILVFTSCCIYDSGQPPCTAGTDQLTDELVYQIFIKDRAGNESNRINTDPITLQCL